MGSEMCIRDRNVVVTGAGHGLGAALAARFARAGHAIALLDLDGEAAERRAAMISESGARCLGLACDVADADDCQATLSGLLDAWDGVDLLVNNAGMTHMGGVADTDVHVLRRVMDVNFFGSVHCTKALLPTLLARRGQIVAISSVAGHAPLAMRAGYVASKHAVQGFFETLRAEHARDGLAVTLVCPSFVRTGIGRRALDVHGNPGAQDQRTGVQHELGAEAAADLIFRGTMRRQRTVWVGREARLASWAHRLAPSVYERLMIRRTMP